MACKILYHPVFTYCPLLIMKLIKHFILSKFFKFISLLLSFKLVTFNIEFIYASSAIFNCNIPQVLANNKIFSIHE